VAHAHDVPVTIRGGGTGNYGQAVPLHGGLIVETTAMNRILEIGEGFVRVEAGALMADINAALIPEGWEMAMFPSTQDIATIGGFVAGGSAGIGSVANGPLREKGNIMQLKALSMESERRSSMSSTPRTPCASTTPGASTARSPRSRCAPCPRATGSAAWRVSTATATLCGGLRAGLRPDEAIARKLCSVVDARIAAYFPGWKIMCRRARTCL
jgi:hypothetical protein